MKRIACVLPFLLAFTGIAAAAPPPPKPVKINLPFQGSVALGVLDARPDVVSGERKETFIGLSRSLYGIPYPAHTPSKKPFAQEFSNLVVRGLKLGGVTVQSVTTTPFDGHQGAIQALQKTGAERLVLVEIRDWWSDTLIHTDLHYDLSLIVLNSQGQELGSSSITGHDELGKRQRPERRDVTTATNDIITTLFAADALLAAFSPEASPVTKAASCTVEQILKMKEAGLSQEQIEAACGSGQ